MKKNSLVKKLALLMSAIMILTSLAVVASATEEPATYDVWDGLSYDMTPFEGIIPNASYDASVNSPIIIDSAAKLAGLSKFVNDAKVKGSAGALPGWPIYITKNIDLAGHPFKSIGCDYSIAMFSGLLEGRLNGEEGKAPIIMNLNIIDSSTNNIGFVGTLRGGAMKNLTFENAKVGHPDTKFGVAIAVGYPCKNVEISGITVKNSTVIGGSSLNVSGIGAIIGVMKADNEITLKDLYAENVNFVCEDYHINPVGGIIGIVQSKQPVHFENCYYSGKIIQLDSWGIIETDLPMGGIVGTTSNEGLAPTITMKNCHYDGQLAYAGEDRIAAVGAFVGRMVSGGSLVLEDCQYTGANADALVGATDALEGASEGLTISITNTVSVADIPLLKGSAEGHTITGEVTYNISEPEPTDPQPSAPADPEPSKPADPQPSEPQGGDQEPAPAGGIQAWVVIVVGIVCLAAGAGIGIVIKKKQ